MTTSLSFPAIRTPFDELSDSPRALLYHSFIRNALSRLVPAGLLLEGLEGFQSLLPIVKSSSDGSFFSIFLLCSAQPGATKFFYDLVSRWLLPGSRLDVRLFFASEFELGEESYSLAEMTIALREGEDIDGVRRHLAILESEICLGVTSPYHASRILQIKGLSGDEKTARIQERVTAFLQRLPRLFDYDIFSQMQHFLVMCPEEFKAIREYGHMSRIIAVFYLFEKELRARMEFAPEKRCLLVKLFHVRLHLSLGLKKVLGVVASLNFLKEHELFDKSHLLKALQKQIPSLELVEESFFVNERAEGKMQLLYLEVEKRDGSDFTLEEIRELRTHLPERVKQQIEQLMRPVFMPRNEEEVMRNILTLSHQLKYTRDLPQVIISFDQQTDVDLSFTVILLRVIFSDSSTLQELFTVRAPDLRVSFDRIKKVGMIRNKYPKEAVVFRIRLPNDSFLRADHSVDLYKARQEVTVQIQKVVGEVRDFNGGMIAKQVEAFGKLKALLGEHAEQNELLLENFFHSIFPVELRSVVSPDLLQKLFFLLLEKVESRSESLFEYESREEGEQLFVLVSMQDSIPREKIFDSIDKLHLFSSQLISLRIQIIDTIYLGYIYSGSDKEIFLEEVQEVLGAFIEGYD